MASLCSDNRAVSSVVGKVLAIGIAVLYIGGMTAILFGGIVPDYERETGEELADRVTARVAGHIEQAVPEANGTVDTRRTVPLPATIEQHSYTLTVRNGVLALNHSDGTISAQTQLRLPEHVTVTDGTYHSGDPLVIRVTGTAGNWTLSLEANS